VTDDGDRRAAAVAPQIGGGRFRHGDHLAVAVERRRALEPAVARIVDDRNDGRAAGRQRTPLRLGEQMAQHDRRSALSGVAADVRQLRIEIDPAEACDTNSRRYGPLLRMIAEDDDVDGPGSVHAGGPVDHDALGAADREAADRNRQLAAIEREQWRLRAIWNLEFRIWNGCTNSKFQIPHS